MCSGRCSSKVVSYRGKRASAAIVTSLLRYRVLNLQAVASILQDLSKVASELLPTGVMSRESLVDGSGYKVHPLVPLSSLSLAYHAILVRG